ncbi:MAG: coproporphyrinogen III oxidase, partial [Alphaproteobacteria bacterium]|nr:coproporphyrinogen III oxidase [Alphaproteobacteria bacterium]
MQSIDLEQWTTAYLNELRFSYQQTPNHLVETIFFGGGTPSLMPPSLMATIIDTIQSLWPCSDNLEITFEANPTS